MKKYIKKCSITFLIVVLAILVCPGHSANAATRKKNDISNGDVVISKSGDYEIVGSTDKYTIRVEKGVKANIWINYLKIDKKEYSEQVPFVIEEKANVVLYVKGENLIHNCAWNDGNYSEDTPMDAIQLKKGSKLTISKDSTGTLELHADGYGSGIGGQGTLNVNGGTLETYGGMYGAGIGNTLNSSKFYVCINGGMVYSYGGIGTKESDCWVYENCYQKAENIKAYDISAAKIVVTGGMLMATDTSVTPKNRAGKTLRMQVFNTKKGSFKSITVDKATYGCKGIKSKGYLALWTPSENSKIELTYANGTKGSIACQWPYLIGDEIERDDEFDLSIGSLLILEHGFIYDNHVYQNRWNYDKIKVTGTTSDNSIMVDGDAKLVLDNVNVTWNENTYQPFITIASNKEVMLLLEGNNTIQAAGYSNVMLLGNHADLCIAADTSEQKLEFILNDHAKGINAECGSIVQYGGSIIIDTKGATEGIFLGNGAMFTLNHGEITSNSEKGKAIHVLANSTVKVCGGTITAKNIGYWDESNEEVSDYSKFIFVNGKVNVANRMMFGQIYVFDGELNCHLLGSGSGTTLYQFGGTINIDRFITNYILDFDYDDLLYRYDTETGKMEGTAIDKNQIYGGSLTETGNVTLEDMEQVRLGRY